MIRSAYLKATMIAGLVCLTGLTACDSLTSALGMSRSDPQDGKVVTEQPLALPPDYKLLPPRETSKEDDKASSAHPYSPDPDLEKHH